MPRGIKTIITKAQEDAIVRQYTAKDPQNRTNKRVLMSIYGISYSVLNAIFEKRGVKSRRRGNQRV